MATKLVRRSINKSGIPTFTGKKELLRRSQLLASTNMHPNPRNFVCLCMCVCVCVCACMCLCP